MKSTTRSDFDNLNFLTSHKDPELEFEIL